MTVALALDLGSSRCKGAAVRADGSLDRLRTLPAPALRGRGLIREGDARGYLETGSRLLASLQKGLPPQVPVALASQRSSFLLWDRRSGAAVTPVISWQDRRAEAWCAAHRGRNPPLIHRTGLLLSPHYAGPKLAHLLAEDASLRRAADQGFLAFGTLETWLLYHFTGGAVHETDLSMAARTLLAEPETGSWSQELLDFLSVPRSLLPSLAPTWGREIPLEEGGLLTATVADQAAGLLGAFGEGVGSLLINLGTGGFVIRGTGTQMVRVPGYLAGPLFAGPAGEKAFATEGTMNGIGQALSALRDIKVLLTERDPLPGRFCIPDTSGLGSPFWRADLPSLFSVPEGDLGRPDRKRLILEGILFRVAGILEDLSGSDPPEQIYLSGGLSGEEFIRLGLPAVLKRPVALLAQAETTLRGAGGLALGRTRALRPPVSGILEPRSRGAYLREKFSAWKVWADGEVKARTPAPG